LKKKLYAGPISARNILTNLIPDPFRPEKSGPTYNSSATNQKLSRIFRELKNVTLEKPPPKLIRQTLVLTFSLRVESLHKQWRN